MINILDKSIYNLISAGEVVEKPASVVKELIENAIDAKASNIIIEILNGGITKIKVSDDGLGIEENDIEKAFLPHATSKISKICDLEKIGTLGFRGEALSSISTVSKTTLISKKANCDMGYKCLVDGGQIGNVEPFASTNGTTLIVENLFFNTPARLKFLRKPKQEETEITNYVSRLILANPNISFKYVADGKLIYQSFGDGLYNAIYCIYGKNIKDNLIEISNKNETLELTGYVGKPTFSKSNRTYQSLFVNNRYVINQSISLAIFKAFENYLMKSTFPFFVLNIKLDLDKVDVNVHPNKLDVKFEHQNEIFGFVYSTILNSIVNNNNPSNLILDQLEKGINKTSFLDKPVDTNRLQVLSNDFNKTNYENINTMHNENASSFSNEALNSSLSNTNGMQDNLNNENDFNKEDNLNEVVLTENINNNNKETNNIKADYPLHEAKFINNEFKETEIINEMDKLNKVFNYNSNNEDKISFATDNGFSYEIAKNNLRKQKENEEQISFYESKNENSNMPKDYKVVGVIFNTFILIEKNMEVFIIDQHAAHERILFDKFMKYQSNSEKASQPLLIPYLINVNPFEEEILNNAIPFLNEIGIEIEKFGFNTYKVTSIPLLFNNLNLDEFFNEIFKDNKNIKQKINIEKISKDYIALKACKHAVKANDILSDEEIEKLFNLFEKSTILLCPHGRPIVIKVTKTEIEKWFKRIV